MTFIPLYVILLVVASSCQNAASERTASLDTIIQITTEKESLQALPRPYDSLTYEATTLLSSAPGTKSVLFNSRGTKLYAMNLEGMSVYEFDQVSKKIEKEFRFHPTKGTGWDYAKSKPIPSFQEKPVEACLSFDDKLLWVSLHNADGIVPIWVDSLAKNIKSEGLVKPVTVIYPGSAKKDSFFVPLIKTGKTPKVISRTSDDKYLLVSNWHSHTVSVLALDKEKAPYGSIVQTIPVTDIPRGIVVDDSTQRSYVAIMGGASIAVVNNKTWQIDTTLNVSSNPRHLVMDNKGHLFVSYNSLATIACLDAETGKALFTAPTHSQPRTIVLSKNHQFIFVTCYSGDMVDVYKINSDSFSKIASLPCKGHPVGVDIYEDDNKLEAWVCSYSTGSISVFSFKKF